jgi:hypothetical protein
MKKNETENIMRGGGVSKVKSLKVLGVIIPKVPSECPCEGGL